MEIEQIAIYGRVSTVVGQNVEMQLCELREYAARRGWQIAGEYVDHVSGAKESRPAFNRLMTDAHRRKFDAVLVWKLDRFGRSLRRSRSTRSPISTNTWNSSRPMRGRTASKCIGRATPPKRAGSSSISARPAAPRR